ncbi:DUF4258 domain-containing protein [Corynebacterium breve]|uniref:DUF4258 domain-containing protein n=1 Tax=Corynebacterium breve TaxID=3049799 RepID=A0ABY8VFS8_9CORY|nr:DUF4258 domain-containing protein [Corynebacterium breve]WIM67957.1 DUF4258 domain-containing protein [Corynebacterium breve]
MNRRLSISGHARRRMRQRGITETDIHRVLEAPDISRPGNEPNRTVYERNLGKVTCVVTVDGSNPVIVVTAFIK